MLTDARVLEAYEIAKSTRDHAHAPYSKFHVGAAVAFKGVEKIFGGCNIENASYGGTVCAERTALWSGITVLGRKEVDFIVVVCDTNPVTVPCAFCLQVINEFSKGDAPIYLGDLEGIKKKVLFKELLPYPFDTLFS
ncbi:cytidine deaminase [Bacteriovorax sp. BSW11_IV]|uniref:cytidine deaminase n=1 Tax=Bacteriovorax sp. BSW11_IV TaxID=1353529 RepID=UPI00038A3A45|nr:cytidine deaminase [Bacteriovorax sp. BSW11_IV]EQC49905.1 cytidine deaminase [Bacteriovorax sp. BSW11_IV]